MTQNTNLVNPEKQNINLKKLLEKVRRLRGYGDMDTYKLAFMNEIYTGPDGPKKKEILFQEFSDPTTYYKAKNKLISELEAQII